MCSSFPGTNFPPKATKIVLLEIVQRNKPEKRYVVDEMAKAAGHRMIRLPPYHSDLKPMELVWAYITVSIFHDEPWLFFQFDMPIRVFCNIRHE